jgi:uncharacterized membrane protein YcjF (UPF0283 family)
MSWYTFGEIVAFMIIAALIGVVIGVLVAGLLRFSKVKMEAARRCREEQRVREAGHTAAIEELQNRLLTTQAELAAAHGAATHWQEEHEEVTRQLEVTYAQSAESLVGLDEIRAAYDERRAEVAQLQADLAAARAELPPAAP